MGSNDSKIMAATEFDAFLIDLLCVERHAVEIEDGHRKDNGLCLSDRCLSNKAVSGDRSEQRRWDDELSLILS